jgi:hypothetical protein
VCSRSVLAGSLGKRHFSSFVFFLFFVARISGEAPLASPIAFKKQKKQLRNHKKMRKLTEKQF